MKFTKLSVLALLLALLVCAFVACGGDTETETETDVETNAPGTDADTETESETETETEPEHQHEIEVVVDEATCSDRGYTREVCKTCSEVVSIAPIQMIDHVAEAEATCTTAAVCKFCDLEITAALGHSFGEATVTKEATCEAEGEKSQTCATCNEKVTETIAKVAHAIANPTDSKASTLKEAGYIKGLCSLCNKDVTYETPVGLVATFDGAADLTEAFAAFANDFALEGGKEGSYTINEAGQLVAVNSPAIMLRDTNGVLMTGKFEIEFDLLLTGETTGNAVVSLNKRDGGKANEMRILSEYHKRLTFSGDTWVALQAKPEGATVDWVNVRIVVDPTHYDYEIYLDGEKYLYSEWVDGVNIVHVREEGAEMAECTKQFTNEVSPFTNLSGKIDGIYFFHFVTGEKIIDNIRVAMLAE